MEAVKGTQSCLGRIKLDELEYFGSLTAKFIDARVYLLLEFSFQVQMPDSKILRVVFGHLNRSSLAL